MPRSIDRSWPASRVSVKMPRLRALACPLAYTTDRSLLACSTTLAWEAFSTARSMKLAGPLGATLLRTRSVGSISSVPTRPAGADKSVLPVSAKADFPDSSTTPPSPPCGPPLASMMPPKRVAWVLSTVIRPPSPIADALAEIFAPASIVVLAAVRFVPTDASPLARASVVPTATRPPPSWPETSIRAPAAIVTASVALTSTCPPLVPAAMPATEMSPATRTSPPRPRTTTVPACSPTLSARILPPAETRVCTMPSTALAVSNTLPPSATMVPVLVTSATTGLPSEPAGASRTCPVTSIDSSPSP